MHDRTSNNAFKFMHCTAHLLQVLVPTKNNTNVPKRTSNDTKIMSSVIMILETNTMTCREMSD